MRKRVQVFSYVAGPACLLVCALLLCCQTPTVAASPGQHFSDFSNPQRVWIEGYEGDAMEPFITRDGRYLFFNNLNEASVNTDLHWAERIDDLHFIYRGAIRGINTPALEAVASMDRQGNFYFVSNRSYDQTASTLYRGKFADGAVTGIELVPGVSLAKPGVVNFDAEISADGDTLYFVESQFSWRGKPKTARILLAHRQGTTFARDDAGSTIFRAINADGLNYAPALAASECEIFFTRANAHGPVIYRSTRIDRMHPFEEPERITAITGFAEAPSLSPDEKSLYYHERENGHFVIYRVTRVTRH